MIESRFVVGWTAEGLEGTFEEVKAFCFLIVMIII